MNIIRMRAMVREAYAGNGWTDKVDKMSDIQVQAVYFSLLERGAFNKKKPEPIPHKTKQTSEEYKPFIGSQLSIF